MEETSTIHRDSQPDSGGEPNKHDPVPEAVDWLLGAILGVIGIAMSAVGIFMYTNIDRASIADVVDQDDMQLNGLTQSEFISAADPFVDWLAAGIGLTGLIAIGGAVAFVVARRRTRRQVSRNGGTTATFWACAVYGGAVTALISSVIPLVSSIGGGASAAYLRSGNPDARIGAAAGAIGTALMIPLLAFLGIGMIVGGAAIGEFAGGTFLAVITIGGGLIAIAINAGLGALGAFLAG
jgi:hypothetical protein